AIHREMGTLKWTLIAIGYQTALAYTAAFVINQVGSALFLGASMTPAIIIGIVLLLAIVILAYRAYAKNKRAAVNVM
ncbi:MAG: ferrous iron transporter B, partial [Eubacterium sp.]